MIKQQPSLSTRPVIIVFDTFGPYHLARIAAAAQHMSVVGLQFATQSQEYAWVQCQDHGTPRIRTATRHGTSGEARKPELARRICMMLDAERPAAVAIPGWSQFGALCALKWCELNRIPAILMSESMASDIPRMALIEFAKRMTVALFSAALVGGTPHRAYVSELGIPLQDIALGYDAVDNGYFSDKVAVIRRHESQVRQKYGLPEAYFLGSARFVEKKNLPRLLQAYALYRRNLGCSRSSSVVHPPSSEPWDLVLLGDGPLRSTLESQLSTLNLHGHVHMPGFKQYPDLPAYYACARAFVHASTTEQWGLVVNEAMASALPVLVSDHCGCARDLVQEGVNGFTFDPYNVEQLAHLMLKLSTLNSQLLTMGLASQCIIADWGPERFASGLRCAVEKALEVGPNTANCLRRFLLQCLVHRSAFYA